MIFYEYGSYENLRTTIKNLERETDSYIAHIVSLQNLLAEVMSRNTNLELENIHLKDFITERDKESNSVSESMMPILQEIVERKNKKSK
jgi:regulator of replication initiation timing